MAQRKAVAIHIDIIGTIIDITQDDIAVEIEVSATGKANALGAGGWLG